MSRIVNWMIDYQKIGGKRIGDGFMVNTNVFESVVSMLFEYGR